MDQVWTVEAELERIEGQRRACEQRVLDDDRRESALLAGLLPASTTMADLLRDLERQTPSIRSQRLHEVSVFLHQPRSDCIRASLRWGPKLRLTDAERHLMRSFQTRRRRLQRYPAVVVAWEYREITAVLCGSSATVTIGSAPAVSLESFVARPAIAVSALHLALHQAVPIVQRHLRAQEYRLVGALSSSSWRP